MVDSKLISQKDTTVEVIDFIKDHIRELFSNSLPDKALQKLITEWAIIFRLTDPLSNNYPIK